MNFLSFCTSIIKYSFYAIFLLVPLVFAGNTSELFELNKMWFTWIVTIIIMLAWSTKMIIGKKIFIQRTPLDIPILLFLLSQIISTIFSLDSQVSWWGYYSRFNGGLLSTITYILLYYAFVSNLSLKHVFRSLQVILFGGILVALWGLPSHFGYDPTCLVFRGTFDTSCWTEAFKPTIRIFSTLGQPAWMAAYLLTLLPLIMALALANVKSHIKFWMYTSLVFLFFIEIIFTNTRAAFLAFGVINIIFWGMVFLKKIFLRKEYLRYFAIFQFIFLASFFIFGLPVEPFYRYTLPGIQSSLTAPPTQAPPTQEAPAADPTPPATQAETPSVPQVNITDSGNIRQYVWQGAIDAWKANPIFGTGVETFAFAYYKFRPVGHNLTSEWDYLYNKAHNEYLNYLTTTGIFGLGSYLAFIGLFIFLVSKWFRTNLPAGKTGSTLAIANKKDEKNSTSYAQSSLLTIGLFTGWVSILITNFFGFSVVIINIFLFLIPLFVFILNHSLPDKSISLGPTEPSRNSSISPYYWTVIIALTCFAGYLIISLIRYWDADVKYALGANLDRVGSYKEAYPLLLEAVQIKQNEPVYKDEFAINVAVLATALAQSGDTQNAAQFASNAIALNDDVIQKHPNNVVYWKNRVRLLYTLAQAVTPEQQLLYYQEALRAIQHAATLAPTDAKIQYNLGVLYGQTGDLQKGIEILKQTILMKPDYKDAYFALGLFYRQSAVDTNNRIINPELNTKAIATYEEIITKFGSDEATLQSIEEWKQ